MGWNDPVNCDKEDTTHLAFDWKGKERGKAGKSILPFYVSHDEGMIQLLTT